MMSIRALGNLGDGGSAAKAASHYYSEKSADYYVEDASPEPEGEWIGEGAERLGLDGGPNRVPDRQDLQLALAGYVAGHQVQNAGKPDRQMGWDVTFSAPKSVSLAWGSADEVTRQAIERAHRAAARAAHDYLAEQITTRRGYAGREREPAQLVSAQFTHHTSRAGDPQLHSHIVIPNFCVRPDGTVGTIESKAFYDHKLAAGALYQADLASRMREMGYGIEAGPRGTFKVAGVDKKLEELFSKRDQQIDELAREREIRTYAGTRGIVLATRPPKQHTTLEERRDTWRQEAKEAALTFGVERNRVRAQGAFEKANAQELVQTSAKALTEQNSIFKERDLIRELARNSYGQFSAKEIQKIVQESPQTGLVQALGQDKSGQAVYSTKEMVDLERDMLGSVRELAKKKDFEVDASKVIQDIGILSDEQRASVLSATSRQAIAVIQGRAGAGKTTTLAAIRGAYERAGYKVEGIALSGQAALNMEKEAGIPSRTIGSWKLDRQPTPKTVVLVDEAGMVGSKGTKEILSRAHQAGAKVIFVGDERQLQPIEAGGALHAVDRELVRVAPEASSQIQTIRRQKEPWMRQAVFDAAKGNTREALRALDEHGRVNVYSSAAVARRELVSEYVEQNATRQQEAVILTHRKSDAAQINVLVRKQLQEKGLVGENKLQIDNGQRKLDLAIGDRLMMTKNEYRQIDVRNGQRGTLQSIDEKARTIHVKMDNGQDKAIALDDYHSLDYGWASTTHKAQGATVERAYVYGHTQEPMANQHATYVQISRAREETKMYAVAGERSIERPELEATTDKEPLKMNEQREKAMHEMAKTWGRDAMKDTTLDYQRQKLLERERQQLMEQARKKQKGQDQGAEMGR